MTSTAGERAFLIEGPAVISFSGGRTSGYMLHQIVRAHGGALPSDIHVIFADTGKEHPATYDFVSVVEQSTGVKIDRVAFDQGDHTTPFDALIFKKNYLPNPAQRFCTEELKVKPIMRFMRERYDHWLNVIGIRADEPRRVAKIRAQENDDWQTVMPLVVAEISEADVFQFWRGRNDALRLPRGFSNCTGCFMKGAAQLVAIEQLEPGTLQWWASKESQIGGTFRKDIPDYAKLIKFANDQGHMFSDDPLTECFCHD